MVNMSAKFDEDALNCSVSVMFKMHSTVQSLSCSQGQSVMDRQMEPQKHSISPVQRVLGIIKVDFIFKRKKLWKFNLQEREFT